MNWTHILTIETETGDLDVNTSDDVLAIDCFGDSLTVDQVKTLRDALDKWLEAKNET